MQPGLDRIKRLCALLGDPQKGLACVHVAGTNGKGSVCTEIASVLSAAGYKTGLYTSPYVLRFEERIQICGKMISGDALAEITGVVRDAVETLNAEEIYPTEFEAITAAAFLYFARERCDVVVLETGLGGRFDATNIIAQPLVCAITSISMDHTRVLGDTLEKIAFEKCGVVKPGRPVVTSALQKPEALAVIRQTARACASSLILADPEACFHVEKESVFGTEVSCPDGRFTIPLPGAHQLENAAIAIECCKRLAAQGMQIGFDAVKRGIEAAFIPARTEILSREPLVILDGSHNEGSTRALAAFLQNHPTSKKRTAVIGLMADKDIDAVLSHLLPVFDSVIAVTPSNPRALPAKELAQRIAARGNPCDFVDAPRLGIDKAFAELYHNCGELIVCGSLYLAADVRAYLIGKIQNYGLKEKNPKGDSHNADDC